MDDTFQIYVNRVARLTLPEAYQSQVQYIQPSPKFDRSADGTMQPVPFPGYTVISPPSQDDQVNAEFYQHLQGFQAEVLQQLEPGLVVPVPPESFHFTLADLIWAGAYRHAAEDPEFESQLQQRVAQSFAKATAEVQAAEPIDWEVIGMFVRTRAVGVCLVPTTEQAYNRVVALRRSIYQNPNLIALGIEQQYNFTAHITLGYFGESAITTDRDRLAEQLNQCNLQWIESPAPRKMAVCRAELRQFQDMTRYDRQPDWAVLDCMTA